MQPPEWATPGAYPVSPGVVRIPMPLPGHGQPAINTYAIEIPDGLAMIDSGWSTLDAARPQLEASLASIGYSLADIRAFYITHLHRDHYTYAIEHRREFGSRVVLGIGEQRSLAVVKHSSIQPHDFEMEMLRECGGDVDAMQGSRRAVDTTLWEEPDEWLDSPAVEVGTRTLAVIPTPGHTRGHLAFDDPEHGLIFTGDHVLTDIVPSVGTEPYRQRSALHGYLTTLRTLRCLSGRRMLPAHGNVTTSLQARCDELIEHHRRRTTQCLDAVGSTPVTVAEVASQLGWTRRQVRLNQLAPLDQMRALFKVLSYLEPLADDGTLVQTTDDGIARFRRS